MESGRRGKGLGRARSQFCGIVAVYIGDGRQAAVTASGRGGRWSPGAKHISVEESFETHILP